MGDLVKLTFGDSLSIRHVRQIRQVLYNQGLCVLPSDTGYSLAGYPFYSGVIANIRLILGRPDAKISLAFASLRQIEKWVRLSAQNERLMDQFCPGPITIVAPLSKALDSSVHEQLSGLLNDEGTLGVRYPDSPVERQLCAEIDRPITTAAIRYPENDHIVQGFDDAFDIVTSRVKQLHINAVVLGVKMNRIKYSDQSTVVTADPTLAAPYVLKEYREGVVETSQLHDAVRRYSLSDYEDAT